MAQFRRSYARFLMWPLLSAALLTSACASQLPTAQSMPVGSVVRAPSGFIDFCMRERGACTEISEATGATGAAPRAEHMALTDQRWRELNDVNVDVNRAIRPETDLQQFGTAEYWQIPTNAGDCEDYALLKRKDLLQKGWPVESLTLATARNQHGELHAVLIASTDRGDFVLDNATNFVEAWSDTPYQWVSRQDPLTPLTWHRAGVGDNNTLTAAIP